MSRKLCFGGVLLIGLLTGGACAPALNSVVPVAAPQVMAGGVTTTTPVAGPAEGQTNGLPSPADRVWEVNLCYCEPQSSPTMVTVHIEAPTREAALSKFRQQYPKGCVPMRAEASR